MVEYTRREGIAMLQHTWVWTFSCPILEKIGEETTSVVSFPTGVFLAHGMRNARNASSSKSRFRHKICWGTYMRRLSLPMHMYVHILCRSSMVTWSEEEHRVHYNYPTRSLSFFVASHRLLTKAQKKRSERQFISQCDHYGRCTYFASR